MANELITLQEFATWTQTTVADLEADPFAMDVYTKTSELAREHSEQPTWTRETAPFKIRMLVLKLARRTYLNPDQVVSRTLGPTSRRVLDEAALAMSLSDEETELLESFKPGVDEASGLWTIRTSRGEVESRTAYLADDSQPNLVGPPWEVPYGDFLESDFFNEPTDTYLP